MTDSSRLYAFLVYQPRMHHDNLAGSITWQTHRNAKSCFMSLRLYCVNIGPLWSTRCIRELPCSSTVAPGGTMRARTVGLSPWHSDTRGVDLVLVTGGQCLTDDVRDLGPHRLMLE